MAAFLIFSGLRIQRARGSFLKRGVNLTVKTIDRLAKAFKVQPIEFFRFD